MQARSLFAGARSWLVVLGAFAVLSGCSSSGDSGGKQLKALQIAPTAPSVAQGLTRQFTATAVFSDGSNADVTNDPRTTWSSSVPADASIDNTGLATGVSPGVSTISAQFQNRIASTDLTVTSAIVTAMEVTPASPSIANGTTQQFTAIAVLSDGSNQDVTNDPNTSWASATPAVATMNNTTSKGLATAVSVGTSNITATLQGVVGSTVLTVTSAVITSVQVTPATPSLAKGTTQQFTATAIFSDNTNQDVTNDPSTSWSSSAPTIASVSTTGLATALTQGASTIAAAFGGHTGSTTLTVTPAVVTGVQVAPASPSIAKGTKKQFTATAVFSDNSSQDVTTDSNTTWTSDALGVATISNAAGDKGTATGVGVGVANITAAFGGKSGTQPLTVTAAVVNGLQVTPASQTIAKGTSLQYTAVATFTDGTNQDVTADPATTWATADGTIATVSNASGTKGKATGAGVGATTISAAYNSFTNGQSLTVTAATVTSIQVTPTNPSIPKGTTQQFTATAIFTDGTNQDVTANAGTTWSSSDTTVVSVSNGSSKGLAAALKVGTATISAAFSGTSGSTLATVSAATLTAIQVTSTDNRTSPPSVPVGYKEQFLATGTFSDGSTSDVSSTVTWQAIDPTVASVDSTGLVTGLKAGNTMIVAQQGNIHGQLQINVRAASLGSIQVTPAGASVPLGNTQQYTATGVFSDSSQEDLTKQVTWSSSDPSIASISNGSGAQGFMRTVAQGTATISAQLSGITGTTGVTVSAATLTSIEVTPSVASVAKGLTKKFTATGSYSDSSTQDITTTVTWSSSNTSIATVSNATPNQGLATGVNTGSVTITATLSGKSGSGSLTVTAAVLQSIAVTPVNQSVAKGTQVQYKATGTFSDTSTQDLTTTVTWASDTTSVATVSNGSGSKGLASTVGEGSANISATQGSVTGSTPLTVTNAVLVSIDVTPANPSLPAGFQQQMTATGNYTDGSTQDLTTSATWQSSNSSVASVNPSGMLFAASAGTATITASFGGKQGQTTATVTAALLQSIAVTPGNANVPMGFSRQYTAIGTYSDASTQDLTTQVTWYSLNEAVATVSNVAGQKGVVSSVAAGSTTVTATFPGNNVSGTTGVTVNNATLSSIAVSPAGQTIHPNTTVQFHATGTFSDASSFEITTQVTWASSNQNVAVINAQGLASPPSSGVVLPQTTTISATKGAVQGTQQLTGSTTPG